ncbi:MAG: hypothetical protein HOW73_00805 [Polyangiaceae bacterium]|nr:hypothetical protein [Polyangiaceae bacterium]
MLQRHIQIDARVPLVDPATADKLRRERHRAAVEELVGALDPRAKSFFARLKPGRLMHRFLAGPLEGLIFEGLEDAPGGWIELTREQARAATIEPVFDHYGPGHDSFTQALEVITADEKLRRDEKEAHDHRRAISAAARVAAAEAARAVLAAAGPAGKTKAKRASSPKRGGSK